MTSTNRNFKDSLFTKLFRDNEKFLEVYNAINGLSLGSDTSIEDVTLDDVLFMDQVNDVAFNIGNKLVVLMEHQSSVNLNMPLRLLLYVGRTYEKLIPQDVIYRKARYKIPKPEFIVLYNGVEEQPDETILSLSDAFESADNLGGELSGKAALELNVRVLNVNPGHNEHILKASSTLDDYSVFITRVRDNDKHGMKLSAAVEEAITFCITHGILADFLTKNGSEVYNMLFTEFRIEDALAIAREEGELEGERRGERRGELRGKLETARGLLGLGLSLESIALATQLPIEQLERELR
ncbi:hypothetical protein FACS18948_0400 [Clostridia bacterium]|nr:hypothetical protein FACS18948_0400 [Clostridia bacterium]